LGAHGIVAWGITIPCVGKDKVKVTCFRNGWCPGQSLACERMKRAVKEYGDEIEYIEVDTDDKKTWKIRAYRMRYLLTINK